VRRHAKVPLRLNEYGALVSFTWDQGCARFKHDQLMSTIVPVSAAALARPAARVDRGEMPQMTSVPKIAEELLLHSERLKAGRTEARTKAWRVDDAKLFMLCGPRGGGAATRRSRPR
jgi:hypothetical protein